jgi:hypothetical protein
MTQIHLRSAMPRSIYHSGGLYRKQKWMNGQWHGGT